MDGYRHIATILGPVGLRGDVKLRPNNESPNWLGSLQDVCWRTPDGETHSLTVASMSEKKSNEVWVRFKGYSDRTSLENAGLVKGQLWVAESGMPPLGGDEFYMDQLPGMAVVTDLGDGDVKTIATVSEWLSSSGTDFLELETVQDVEGVQGEKGSSVKVVIPFSDVFFPSVNKELNHIMVSATARQFLEDSVNDAREIAEKKAQKKEARKKISQQRRSKRREKNKNKNNTEQMPS